MVTISKATARQNFYETVYDTLKAYATAGSYSSATQPTITAAYVSDNPTFPMIVIHNPMRTKNGYTFGSTITDGEVRLIIDIFTSGQKQKKMLDQLSDDIDSVLGDTLSEFDLVSWDESIAMPTSNDNKIANKTIAISYRYTN